MRHYSFAAQEKGIESLGENMAAPSRRRRQEVKLACNMCETQFVGPVWCVSIESSDRGTLGWVPDRDAAVSHICPNPQCRSKLIRVMD
jgi:hypothetical protein